ncbi:MAG TPA: imidazole glycerol phosphate synthase subunit HisF [Luteibaculaceae bacterium]|nr:imidazole glycerol phosphate synthase subunit HisF [Luteibaculaceae bacterium]
MLTKRIIPCLDIKNGTTVKGVNFVGLREMGDPVELAKRYSDEGADELVFLDITATVENRGTMVEWVGRVAHVINIPFTVGGGISSVEDAKRLLDAGADKISVNSAAYKRPELLSELESQFGKQCVVLAIDTNFEQGDWFVYLSGGRIKTETRCMDWAIQGEKLGAGEILLTSMTADGTRAGFALDITGKLASTLNIPVIASGGAGTTEHFVELFEKTKADAALAASIFHENTVPLQEVKSKLRLHQIPVR